MFNIKSLLNMKKIISLYFCLFKSKCSNYNYRQPDQSESPLIELEVCKLKLAS